MNEQFLTMDLTFSVKNASFNIDGNVKKEKQSDLIIAFLRTQLGQGIDNSEANKQDKYHISIKWFPHLDRFQITSDTGNKGLRDGILRTVSAKLG